MRFLVLLFAMIAYIPGALAQDPEGEDLSPTQAPGVNNNNNSKYTPSPDTAAIFYTQLNERWPGEKIIRLNDTILTGFNYYLPTESATSLYALTGNAGHAYRSMVFSMPEYSGFKFTPFDFTEYKFTNRNVKYYQTTTPYTNVFYSTGPAKEQVFGFTHSQNITGGLTLGLDLDIVNSIGLYQRQKADDMSFAGTAQFVNRNENYVVLGNYRNNTIRWRENGGVRRISLFTNNTETDRKRIPINIRNADNYTRESGFQARQFYYFGKVRKNPVTDSLRSDTIGPKKLHRYYNPERSNFIRHTITYSRSAHRYTDNDPFSGFYREVLIDSTQTFDSLYYHELSNDISIEAGVGRARGSSKAILLRAGIEHISGIYKNDTIKRNFNRITPYAYLSANAFGLAKAEGMVWVTTGKPFNGDKGVSGLLTLPGYDNSENWGNLKASASLMLEQPFYLYQHHYSNHFIWDNAFGQQTTLSFKASYEHRFFKAGFNVYNLTDYVYLDTVSRPVKEQGSVAVTQIWAFTDLKWRHFESQIYGIVQNSSKQGVINLPQFAGRASLYYSRALFKRALYLQSGFAVLFNTPFYEDAYMPALRAFHVQNTIETGGYPYVDVFVNFRVKRARMFLMMKNLNQGMMEADYIMIPGYPMPDRGLRFGVSWSFYD
jgi:hypothetical protein